MTQPIEEPSSGATDAAEFSNPLHDLAKAAFALAKDQAAIGGDGNEAAAFQALIIARLIAAAHEVSQAMGAPDKHFGQAHYCYRNATTFAEEALHMIMHGGELLDLDRRFCAGPTKMRELPAWWNGEVCPSVKGMRS
jgi:hypothetical protein